MIIDWEHHYLPEELWVKKGGKLGERTTFYEHDKPRGTLNPELYDIENHFKMMDNAGIDMAVLSIAISNDNTRIAMEEGKIWNDDVAKLIKKYPKKIAGLAAVPPLGGKPAMDEIERALGFLGMKGVIIRSQANGLSMDSRELYPFYKKMQQLGGIIFIHPSGVQMGMDILNAPYDLNRSIGRELDLIIATTRIIWSGVLEDFPDLKFVIAHKGGGIAALKERIQYWVDTPEDAGELRKLDRQLTKSFDEYFSRMYFDLAGHHGGMNSVKCALTGIKPGQLMLGTDYPQEFLSNPDGIKTYVENIKNLDMPKKSIDLMLGGTAKKLLGISK